jgi:hypothetical protein
MKLIISIIIIAFITSCGPMKRHDRIVRKYPFVHTERIDTIRDTVRINVPKVELDTHFHINYLRDTIVIEQERLKIRMFTVHDSIFVDGECDSVTVEKVIEKIVPVTVYEEKNLKWWWFIIPLILIFVSFIVGKLRQQ